MPAVASGNSMPKHETRIIVDSMVWIITPPFHHFIMASETAGKDTTVSLKISPIAGSGQLVDDWLDWIFC
jgi:hypothetical protein